MAKKQSKLDRLKRLNESRCPIHGLFMSQVGEHYIYSDPCNTCGEKKFIDQLYIVKCPRKNCDIKGVTESYDLPVQLLPEFLYLLKID